MIHRFVDLLEVVPTTPISPLMVRTQLGATNWNIWTIGEAMTPFRLTSSAHLTTSPTKLIGDPRLSPDESRIVYSYAYDTGGAPDAGEIHTITVDDSTHTVLKSGLTPFTDNWSYAPAWSPDGAYIVFCELATTGGANNKISRIDADGSNYTVLHTIPSSETSYHVSYSPSGDYICFTRRPSSGAFSIWVMNADGSSPTSIRTVAAANLNFVETNFPAWQNGADVLGWFENGFLVADDCTFRTANFDGTGLTTLATLPNRDDAGPIHMFGWLSDDSAMVTSAKNGTTRELALVDGGGLTMTGIVLDPNTGTGTVLRNEQWVVQTSREAPRIYFQQVNLNNGAATDLIVASVLEDLTDYRVDFDPVVETAILGATTIVQYGIFSRSV